MMPSEASMLIETLQHIDATLTCIGIILAALTTIVLFKRGKP